MPPSDDWSWERYRPLLKLRYRQLQLDPRFQRRFDASDLVQDVFVEAWENRDQFRGHTEGERIKWLQMILHNKAMDKIRKETAGKCDVRREQSINDAFSESRAHWESFFVDYDARPDHEAERQEFLLRLAAAMEKLPQDQRDAVLLVQLMGRKLAEAEEQLGCTEKAVSGRLRRGLEKLSKLLPEYKPPNPRGGDGT